MCREMTPMAESVTGARRGGAGTRFLEKQQAVSVSGTHVVGGYEAVHGVTP